MSPSPSNALDAWTPRGRSALVRELAALPAKQRSSLHLTDGILAFADMLVTVCAVLIDDADTRSLNERLEQELDGILSEADWASVTQELEHWAEDHDQLLTWAKKFESGHGKLFLRRLLGAARFDRLERALRQDAALLVVAARRGLRNMMPVLSAMDACFRELSPSQAAEIPGLADLVTCSFVDLALQADGAIDKLLALDLPVEEISARPRELDLLPGGIEEISKQLSTQVAVESLQFIEDLNGTFVRKIRGAKDALAHSADPVSQAANSLIELIDRLLRSAFAEAEVLAWIRENCPTRWNELTYVLSDTKADAKPTKRGQALCFVYAGGAIAGYSVMHEATARAIVATRNHLQGLKHAEVGSDAEQESLVERLASVEGFLVLVCRLSWLGAEPEALQHMRERLREPAA